MQNQQMSAGVVIYLSFPWEQTSPSRSLGSPRLMMTQGDCDLFLLRYQQPQVREEEKVTVCGSLLGEVSEEVSPAVPCGGDPC